MDANGFTVNGGYIVGHYGGYGTNGKLNITNCYAISQAGSVITTSTSLYGTGSVVTVTSHDGSTLTPGFTSTPFTGYTSLTSEPTFVSAPFINFWNRGTDKILRVNNTDYLGNNIVPFFTDLVKTSS